MEASLNPLMIDRKYNVDSHAVNMSINMLWNQFQISGDQQVQVLCAIPIGLLKTWHVRNGKGSGEDNQNNKTGSLWDSNRTEKTAMDSLESRSWIEELR